MKNISSMLSELGSCPNNHCILTSCSSVVLASQIYPSYRRWR